MDSFIVLAEQCASGVSVSVLERIVRVESSFNPWAIGVVGGRLSRQPKNKQEAISTAYFLQKAGWNFSMGLGQINRHNLVKYGLSIENVFEPCDNLRATAAIFNECLQRASQRYSAHNAVLAAFSCYYSGNFSRGFKPEGVSGKSYVDKIVAVKPSVSSMPLPVIASGSDNINVLRRKETVHIRKASMNKASGMKLGHGRITELRGD